MFRHMLYRLSKYVAFALHFLGGGGGGGLGC